MTNKAYIEISLYRTVETIEISKVMVRIDPDDTLSEVVDRAIGVASGDAQEHQGTLLSSWETDEYTGQNDASVSTPDSDTIQAVISVLKNTQT